VGQFEVIVHSKVNKSITGAVSLVDPGIPNSTGAKAVIIYCARCVGKKPFAF
jgi:hypothetical protein